MSACPQCGYQENIITCEFRGCQNEAEYEGWYRVLDFAGQPTGLIQKMRVCHICVKFLIGNSPTPRAGDEGDSPASEPLSTLEVSPVEQAESTPALRA